MNGNFRDPLGSARDDESVECSPEGGAEREVGHLPVMVDEVLDTLAANADSLQIDATLGGAGHAERILESSAPDGRLLGLDADGRPSPGLDDVWRASAIEPSFASPTSASWRRSRPRPGSEPSTDCSWTSGFRATSSVTLSAASASGPAAPRHALDTSRGRPAADLLATMDARELTALFRKYGEEPFAGRISRAIVETRARTPIETAEQLAGWSSTRCRGRPAAGEIHPATRVFQALRIAVNDELGPSRPDLAASLALLRPGGRLVVLSYHSLEDRIVKRFIATEQRGCICPPEVPVCVCGRQPRLRSLGRVAHSRAAEIQANPRSRSARLRGAERVAA